MSKCILFLSLISLISSKYIVLPFKTTRPFGNKTNFYAIHSPIDYIKSITSLSQYTPVSVGSPSQTVNFFISFSEPYFLYGNGICSNEAMSFYRQEVSKSFVNDTCFNKYSIYLDNPCYINESFTFYNDLYLKSNQTIDSVRLLYSKENRDIRGEVLKGFCGFIGLSVSIPNGYKDKIETFVDNMKGRKYIKRYFFTYHYFRGNDKVLNYYTSKYSSKYSQYDGVFILGEKPDEYDNEHYSSSQMISTNTFNNGKTTFWGVKIDKIVAKSSKFEYFAIKDERAYFDDQVLYIVASTNFFDRIKLNYFNKLINDKVCFEDVYTKDEIDLYNVIYCNKNKISMKDFEDFPSLYFYNNDLEFTFTFEYSELFDESKDRIFFKILQGQSISGWQFGKMFLDKYQFAFDYSQKTINFL